MQPEILLCEHDQSPHLKEFPSTLISTCGTSSTDVKKQTISEEMTHLARESVIQEKKSELE